MRDSKDYLTGLIFFVPSSSSVRGKLNDTGWKSNMLIAHWQLYMVIIWKCRAFPIRHQTKYLKLCGFMVLVAYSLVANPFQKVRKRHTGLLPVLDQALIWMPGNVWVTLISFPAYFFVLNTKAVMLHCGHPQVTRYYQVTRKRMNT